MKANTASLVIIDVSLSICIRIREIVIDSFRNVSDTKKSANFALEQNKFSAKEKH